MDYKDYLKGHSGSNFFIKGKKELIGVFLSKIKKQNIKILNLGAGTGDEISVLREYGKIYAIDINKDALKLIPKNLCFEKKVADACNLPYKSNFFDIVVSSEVLEHIKDDAKAVSEAKRVLKKNGYLIFTVPAFQLLYSSHDKALEHKRRYNKRRLSKLLSGFRDLKLYYWNSTLFLPVAAMRLVKKNSKTEVDDVTMPKLINSLLYLLLKIETKFVKHKIPLPPGITIAGYCRK